LKSGNTIIMQPLAGNLLAAIDLFPYEWDFDLDMPGQKFHHSLKEHHKISNIPKLRCEML
jgi:hypothetical protein